MSKTNTKDMLLHGTIDCLPSGALEKKLESGKKLVIKLGMDPTAPDLHLGHAVVLKKMKQFQDLGHTVVFLIGDFTARIGDPTGKSKTRPPLTNEEINQNAQTYFEQVSRILDPEKITVRYNSEWLEGLQYDDIIRLTAKFTVSRLIERDDFAKRLAKKQPVALHELLYPITQAYDSVALDADVELGGSDQLFNLLCGRSLQEQSDQDPQVVLTVPLLEGLDGVEKMSKSLGNAVGLAEPAEQAYGKLMSISDELMWRYYDILLHTSESKVATMKADIEAGLLHPMDCKKALAFNIVEEFWSQQDAQHAQEQFQSLFQKKDYSKAQEVTTTLLGSESWIVAVLRDIKAVQSSSEAKRLLSSGAVKINNEQIKDFKAQIIPQPDMIIKVGKHRIYKIVE